MEDNGVASNSKAKRNQQRNLLFVVIIISTVAVMGTVMYIMKLKSHVAQPKATSNDTIKLSGLGSDINDSSIALQRLDKKVNDFYEKIKAQENINNNLHLDEKNPDLVDMQEKIHSLEEKIRTMHNPSKMDDSIKQDKHEIWPPPQKDALPYDFPTPDPDYQKNAYKMHNEHAPVVMPAEIHIESFKPEAFKIKTSTNYIPVGTYVKALLVQGLDASASISSQTHPRPILLRLVSNGSLPNEVSTHIEGCRITAAAFGDISSERAFMRLETISCTLKSKEIIEYNVEGYVVGEDGKDGLRGTVVRRERDLLTNGFLSGLASGVGSGISQSFNKELISPMGMITETNGNDVFKKGAAQGVSNSFDRLSKYYIDRAEQFQPVVQIAAGREVDVVFLKGFYLQSGLQPLILAQDK